MGRASETNLTIKRAAAVAGVTVRAIRHYHKLGLLPEPDRDLSGYRRYDAVAIAELIRIRTLAAAGVPLARVGELIRAGPDELGAALREIDAELQRRIRELEARRSSVAALGSSEWLALPDHVVAYLDRLRELGLSERAIEIERDGWLLLNAHAPEQVELWIADKARSLDDGTMRQIYLRFDEAFDWDPDDSRLIDLADELERLLPYLEPADEGLDLGVVDSRVGALLDAHTLAASPAWRRLYAILEERGLPLTNS